MLRDTNAGKGIHCHKAGLRPSGKEAKDYSCGGFYKKWASLQIYRGTNPSLQISPPGAFLLCLFLATSLLLSWHFASSSASSLLLFGLWL